MKLYAWQPKGHVQKSFFVMANSEQEAIDSKIEELISNDDEYYYSVLNIYGWKKEHYRLTVAEINQVILNSND